MKNISLTVSPYTSGYTPPSQPPSPVPIIQSNYQVTIGVQFDNEDDAISYSKFMINAIQTFKQGDR